MKRTSRKNTASASNTATILTVPEAAQLLRIHPDTLRRKAFAGEIQGVKVGRAWRFNRDALEKWIAGSRPTPLT